MKNNRSEEFLNFEMDPSRYVWKRIESNLPAKKKKRWFIFFLLAAIVAGGISILYVGKNDGLDERAVSDLNVLPKNINPVEGNIEKEFGIPSKSNTSSTALPTSTPLSSVNTKTTSIQKNSERPIETSSSKKNLISVTTDTKNKNHIIQDNEKTTLVENNFSDASIAAVKNELDDVFLVSSIRPVIESENFQNLIEKKFPELINTHLSRVIFYAEAGKIFTVNPPADNPDDEFSQVRIEGISCLFLNAGVRYDLSTKIRLSLGVSHSTTGLIQEGYTTVINDGPPGSVESYVINTSIGNITGSGTDFNTAFFDSPDSILFPPVAILAPLGDSIARRTFKLRQEFSFIEIPVTIIFKPVERRFTPFVGFLFSPGFLSEQKTFLNDKRIAYKYEQKRSDIFLSAGITGGIDYHLSNRFGIYLNTIFRLGLNELVKSSSNWKPNQVGINAGLNYRLGR